MKYVHLVASIIQDGKGDDGDSSKQESDADDGQGALTRAVLKLP